MFWFFILLISLGVVRLVAPPILRALRGEGDGEDDGSAKNAGMRIGALAVVFLTPLAAALIYLQIGAPESLSAEFQTAMIGRAPDPRAEIAALPADERAAMIENMVTGLAARLAAEPDDIEGWRMLGRSYGILNRAEDSADAYRELIARDENAGDEDWRNFALALLAVSSGNGTAISDEALSALTTLLSFDENDPLALFYLGIAARERGENGEALSRLRQLISVLPEDAPILPQLQTMIDELAGSDG